MYTQLLDSSLKFSAAILHLYFSTPFVSSHGAHLSPVGQYKGVKTNIQPFLSLNFFVAGIELKLLCKFPSSVYFGQPMVPISGIYQGHDQPSPNGCLQLKWMTSYMISLSALPVSKCSSCHCFLPLSFMMPVPNQQLSYNFTSEYLEPSKYRHKWVLQCNVISTSYFSEDGHSAYQECWIWFRETCQLLFYWSVDFIMVLIISAIDHLPSWPQ